MPTSIIIAVVSYVAATAAVTALGILAGTIAAALVTAVIVAAVSYTLNAVFNKPDSFSDTPDIDSPQFQSFEAVMRDRLLTVRQAITHWQVIYGRCRVGGAMTFMEATDTDSVLHVVITLASHRVEAIEEIWLNEEIVPLDGSGNATGRYAGFVTILKSLGDEAAGVQPFPTLVTATGGVWKNSHYQQDRAKIYLKLTHSQDLFPSGIPNITAVVQGKHVIDPRTSPTETAYSNNAALCIADFLADTNYGFSATFATEIDEASLIAAANVCDESVTILPSGTEARFTCNGAFDVNTSPRQTIGKLLTSYAGQVVFIGGVWLFLPAVYRTPTVTLTLSDLRAGIRVMPRLSREDLANSVKGIYISELNFWQPSDFPPISVSTYVTEDSSEVLWRELDLPYTTSGSTAQRIARIMLEKNRQQIAVQMRAKLGAYQLQPGDTVMLTIDHYGWAAKVFEIVDSTLAMEESEDGIVLGTDLTLRETVSTIYDWTAATDETVVDQAPDSNLPDPFNVPVSTGLTLASGDAHLLLQGDGTVVSRIHASGWTVPVFVLNGGQIEIQHILASVSSPELAESDWDALGQARYVPGNATFAYLSPVQDAVAYHVRIRGISSIGVRSAWETVSDHTVIGKTAVPDNVAGLAYAHQGNGTLISWSEIGNADRDTYEVRQGGDWDTGQFVGRVRGLSVLMEPQLVGTVTTWTKAYDTTGNPSDAATQLDVTITAPAAPSPSYEIIALKVQLTWPKPTLGSYEIAGYEVKHGASWAAGTSLGTTDSTTFRAPIEWTTTRTFWVKAFDVAGNYGSEGSVVATVNAPSAPVLTTQFILSHAELSWTVPAASLPIENYEIRYGADGDNWAAATNYTFTKATRLAIEGDWVGARRWFVAALDQNGNVGTDDSETMTITAPAAVLITAQVVDNNVLLFWSESLSTLPVRTYKIKRGASWAAATVIGNKSGGFTTVFETVAGTFNYWVAGIDSAGNEGTPASVQVTVSQPPDFVFLVDYDSTFNGTFSNAAQSGSSGYVALPIDITETWAQHFETRGGSPNWQTIQDQINAGYPIYAQPTVEEGYYEEIIDYGSTIPSTKITVTATGVTISGTITTKVTISVAEDSSPTEWTDFDNTTEIFVTNFRYVKVRFTATSTSSPIGDDLYELRALNTRLDAKLISDAGTVTCASGDAGGTTVAFNVTFIDVTSITVTPKLVAGSPEEPVTAIYDFVDAPNPTDFKILLFNTAGGRVSGDASWSVKGY